MPRLISRAEFARLAGVSKPAITKACKGLLRPTRHRDRIDVDHPAAVAYLAAKGAKPPGPPAVRPAPTDTPAPPPTTPTKAPATARSKPAAPPGRRRRDPPTLPADGQDGSTEYLGELADVLRPLLDRFGTDRRFRDWLVALKEIEVIREKRLANEETEGRLIDRAIVRHVVGAYEGANKRLLSDPPKTITRRLYAMAKSGVAIEQAEAAVREALSAHLKATKATAARALKDA